jgi:hypothetical protein
MPFRGGGAGPVGHAGMSRILPGFLAGQPDFNTVQPTPRCAASEARGGTIEKISHGAPPADGRGCGAF